MGISVRGIRDVGAIRGVTRWRGGQVQTGEGRETATGVRSEEPHEKRGFWETGREVGWTRFEKDITLWMDVCFGKDQFC